MTSPYFSKPILSEQLQDDILSDHIVHTTLPAEHVRNVIDSVANTKWFNSFIDWKFDNVNNSDSAPRLITAIALPLEIMQNNNFSDEIQEQMFKSWNTAEHCVIDNKWYACKFDLAQCYRMIMPHRYRNLYNVRRSLVDQTTNKPVMELKNGMYASLQFVEEEKGNDKSYSSKPMMSGFDISKCMNS